MKGWRAKREDLRPLIDSVHPETGRLLKSGILSMLLHIALGVFLIVNVQSLFLRKMPSVYRVTIRPYAPRGAIQSVNPGGGPEGTSTTLLTRESKTEESLEGSALVEKAKPDLKVEKPEKGGTSQPAKKQKSFEQPKKEEMGRGINLSKKGEKEKNEKESTRSLQEAIADIHKKVALDEIQKRVSRRGKMEKPSADGDAVGRQTAEGQPPSKSSQRQTAPSSGVRSGSETGSGVGPGIGPGTGGYPIGGVPWGSPQGSSGWNSRLDEYYSMIWAKIKEEWALPENLPKGKTNLETIIVVLIDRDGKIQKSWFEKRSGNTLYDQMAMRAIKKAEPLPSIPKEFSDKTLEIGIRFYPD